MIKYEVQSWTATVQLWVTLLEVWSFPKTRCLSLGHYYKPGTGNKNKQTNCFQAGDEKATSEPLE